MEWLWKHLKPLNTIIKNIISKKYPFANWLSLVLANYIDYYLVPFPISETSECSRM